MMWLQRQVMLANRTERGPMARSNYSHAEGLENSRNFG